MNPLYIRALQQLLKDEGFDPGPVDGLDGPRTQAAVKAFSNAWKASPTPAPLLTKTFGPWPSYAGMEAFYGPPASPACSAGRVRLPFPFPLAWDMEQRISSFPCHLKVAEVITSIFAQAAEHYGEQEFRRLQLDQFGGCYADRPMRGSTRRSTHAWGAAFDIDPVGNELSKGRDQATLDDPAYDPWWKIVEEHGGVSLGRLRNYDWMHIQFATL